MKLYIWRDTRTCGGSSFGGTLCAYAKNATDARYKIRMFFLANPGESGYDDMDKVICSDGSTANDWLNQDLLAEPETSDVLIAFGGDL